METKTAKIISVQENRRNYQGKNGPTYVHMIKFENDQHNKEWEFHSTKQTCEKFKVGETQTFGTDIQQNGQYTNYKIKPAKEAGGGGGKGQPRNERVIVAQNALTNAVNYLIGKNHPATSEQDILNTAEKFYNWSCQKGGLS